MAGAHYSPHKTAAEIIRRAEVLQVKLSRTGNG